MSHVTEKLAEFMFEELSASEMTEAKRHLTECGNCRDQVARFQQTLAVLKSEPEVELPRDIVFEFEKPRATRVWKWFPAMATIAALLLITVAIVGNLHVQWRNSELTVAFGETEPAPQAGQTAELATEVERLKGYVAYLQGRQDKVERDAFEVQASVQPVTRAHGSPTGD